MPDYGKAGLVETDWNGAEYDLIGPSLGKPMFLLVGMGVALG
jgi:hypothetical protein